MGYFLNWVNIFVLHATTNRQLSHGAFMEMRLVMQFVFLLTFQDIQLLVFQEEAIEIYFNHISVNKCQKIQIHIEYSSTEFSI